MRCAERLGHYSDPVQITADSFPWCGLHINSQSVMNVMTEQRGLFPHGDEMSHATHPSMDLQLDSTDLSIDRKDAVYQAYQLLHVGFAVAPIVAGLDKFFHFLVDWDAYLAPSVNRAISGHGHAFMLVVGVIEIIAGIGVALRPKIFAYVVAVWLLGIIVNLLLIPPSNAIPHYDVALRDFGLLLGALALGRLSGRFSR